MKASRIACFNRVFNNDIDVSADMIRLWKRIKYYAFACRFQLSADCQIRVVVVSNFRTVEGKKKRVYKLVRGD